MRLGVSFERLRIPVYRLHSAIVGSKPLESPAQINSFFSMSSLSWCLVSFKRQESNKLCGVACSGVFLKHSPPGRVFHWT